MSPVPPWNTTSSTSQTGVTPSSAQDLWRGSDINRQPSFIDICFEHNNINPHTSSSSHHIPARDSSWANAAQVESLEQLLPTYFDFDLFLDPASAGLDSSSSSHTPSTTSPNQLDLPLDLPSHEFDQPWLAGQIDLGTIGVGEHAENMLQPRLHPTTTGPMASPLDLVGLEMDRFTSASTDTTVTSIFDNNPTTTTSPISLKSRPILAPKHTSPATSSFSVSPPITFIDSSTKPATTAKPAPSKKRSRTESSIAGDSSHSAQDSEDEKAVEKRRRNTMAARRFRKRKLDHVAELESKLSTVTQERDDLKLQIAKWEGEVMALRKLLERKD
ncbi:hypothetical protein BGW36DRAFT_362150 [Talaromyces proteolyticus]|uniref:BZIP domain-containing protein n=1 Tax=Talaromyces proteolyticus TaxID=1131652 RepID=A0AAD4PT36_9EURO|nr:uncharacterized protein BGW36DRAFT_362150 [Talaromyces proteolyticus]KAH8692595.1 hypothetical protein BGW36DRAFT_362150 [Talaromyces proteolyticus]